MPQAKKKEVLQVPRESEREPVTQQEFARRPPTAEDEYFFNLEKNVEDHNLGLDTNEHEQTLIKLVPQEPSPAPPDSIWIRIQRWIVQTLNKGSDTNWRP
jgi:hypothetical protein